MRFLSVAAFGLLVWTGISSVAISGVEISGVEISGVEISGVGGSQAQTQPPIPPLTPPPLTSLCAADLPDRFRTWLQEPALQGATIGVALETLEGSIVYHYQADRRLIPASTQKLLTTAAALAQWDSDRTWATTLHLNLKPGSTELWITGQGDPSLTEQSLQNLAQEVATTLRQRQITHLDRLVGDDRFLGAVGVPPTWEIADTQSGYGAPVNALVFTHNAIPLTLWPQSVGHPLRIEWEIPQDALDWDIENFSVSGETNAAEFVAVRNLGQRSGRSVLRVEGVLQAGAAPEPVSVAVLEPGQRFLQHFHTALETQGLTVHETRLLSFPDSSPASLTAPTAEVIAIVPSPPLSDLITITNQQSQNLYAEILLRWLGQANSPPLRPGMSPDMTPGMTPSPHHNLHYNLHYKGVQHLTNILLQWGLTPDEFTIADGSGLSRHNLITPAALVQVLQYSAQAPWSQIYRTSLSAAGESGTLARRFAHTPLSGKLWGKTGSMTGILALAGYLNPDTYPPLAFSILINNSVAPSSELSKAIDRLLEDWINLQTCHLSFFEF